MSIVETLTEGIVNRDMEKEGQLFLINGLKPVYSKVFKRPPEAGMARLLENQAKELLREA